MSSAPTLYIIDGHAQFFRAYHAIRSGLSSPVTREPTNLTFGFVGMILKLLREQRPEYLAVVIDASGDRKTFRSELDPEYKANRDPPPSDFHPQVERCLSILEQMNIPVLAEEGVEADDVIATIVRRLRRERPDLRVRIVSKDKDLGQLLDDHVELFDAHTGVAVTVEDLFDGKGVRPDQVVDMLALMGDSVDNVKGVPGIGPKTAAQLITQYGSLANLLDHLGELKGKRRENIEATRDRLPLNLKLVRLKDDVEVEFDLARAAVGEAWRAKVLLDPLISTLKDLAFNRYQDELRAVLSGGAVDASRAAAAPEVSLELMRESSLRSAERARDRAEQAPVGSLFEDTAAPALRQDTAAGDYATLRRRAEIVAFIESTRGAEVLALDTETDGLAAVSANLCGVSLSIAPGRAVYIPTRSPEQSTHCSVEEVVELLRPILEDSSVPKCGHNLKFDMNVLRRAGIRLRGIESDSMVASHVVDATRSSHGLDGLARGLLNHECTPIADVIGEGRAQRRFDEAPLSVAGPYAAEDADVALRLRGVLLPQVHEMGLDSLFRDLEMPLVAVLAEIEWNGIRLDVEELRRQRGELAGRIDGLRAKIVEAAPHPFNPDSPKQLAAVLFNTPDADPPGLGLKVIRRNKTGPSTDQEVLEKLAAEVTTTALPELIVEYRQLTKLVNTYLVALELAVDRSTGRVHASFHQTGTATGRISSSDPNLQNIPIRTDVGRAIRKAFVAEPGNVLVSADYSQIELRVLAHLSGDEGLIDAFRRGLDIHTAVAAEVFGVPVGEVTSGQRGTAKMVNFGIVYGITAFGLARRLGGGTTNERASQIIADYKARFSGIDAFLQSCVSFAREHGFVETMLKRRRAVPQIHSRNPQERALGERIAINTVVQGSAADLIKLAMIDLHRAVPPRFPGAKMLLQIHDELVFEVEEPQAESLKQLVIERMSGAMSLKVPLVADASIGRNWSEA